MSDSTIRFSFSALKLLLTLKYIDTLTARFRQNAHGNAGLMTIKKGTGHLDELFLVSVRYPEEEIFKSSD